MNITIVVQYMVCSVFMCICVYIHISTIHTRNMLCIHMHAHINIMNIKKGISMIDALRRTNDCLYSLYNKETITT